MKKRFYAVRIGRECNVVVRSWLECQKLVGGFSGAAYKGFNDEDLAINYASAPVVSRIKVHKERKQRPNETLNQRFNRINHCVERRTYHDGITGELFVNRCVRRKGPAPIRGINYQPTNDTSIPWE